MRQYETKRERAAAEALAAKLDDPATFAGIEPESGPVHPLAWEGVTGYLDGSRAEHLQQRRDVDAARWRGYPIFTRHATPAERVYVARRLGADHARTSALKTRVDCRSGGWRRSWPLLAAWQPEKVAADQGVA